MKRLIFLVKAGPKISAMEMSRPEATLLEAEPESKVVGIGWKERETRILTTAGFTIPARAG